MNRALKQKMTAMHTLSAVNQAELKPAEKKRAVGFSTHSP
jgi:hypothetical protein